MDAWLLPAKSFVLYFMYIMQLLMSDAIAVRYSNDVKLLNKLEFDFSYGAQLAHLMDALHKSN